MSTYDTSDIEATDSTDENDIHRWRDGGYARLGDGDSFVYEHQLAAIAGGADPHDVFGDGAVCHHLIDSLVNTPETVVAIDRGTHQRLHRTSWGHWFFGEDGIPRLKASGKRPRAFVPPSPEEIEDGERVVTDGGSTEHDRGG